MRINCMATNHLDTMMVATLNTALANIRAEAHNDFKLALEQCPWIQQLELSLEARYNDQGGVILECFSDDFMACSILCVGDEESFSVWVENGEIECAEFERMPNGDVLRDQFKEHIVPVFKNYDQVKTLLVFGYEGDVTIDMNGIHRPKQESFVETLQKLIDMTNGEY